MIIIIFLSGIIVMRDDCPRIDDKDLEEVGAPNDDVLFIAKCMHIRMCH